MGVGLFIPAFDNRVRNARSAAIVNTDRSVLLLLRGVVLVNEQGYDGRHQNGESNRPRKREEVSWSHGYTTSPSTPTIIKAYNDKPPYEGERCRERVSNPRLLVARVHLQIMSIAHHRRLAL